MAGLIKYRKSKMKLTYREGKPEVYKLRQLIYPTVGEKQLVKYAANSANIPESTLEACVEAIVQAIVYFAINGSQVTIPNVGGFYVKVNSKTAHTLEECTTDTITRVCLSFRPCTELRETISGTKSEIVDAPYSISPEAGGGDDDEDDGE